MSFKNLLENFGHTANDRVEAAIAALKKGRGVLVVDIFCIKRYLCI